MKHEKLDREKAEKDEAYRDYWRFRCQTDLLFLANVLGYNKMVDRVHRPVADACIQKNPDTPLENLSALKAFLHLDPRGTYKSTLEITDAVQWIICYPEIRICVLTATKPLAAAIAGEITDPFVVAPTAEKTDFQFLFPEFCITPKDKRVGEYTAPCRKRNWREATVMAFSIETTISGWHFDVLMPDDPVDTQNSSTTQGIEKVKRNFRINKKTLMPWGYILFKGTRYNPFDLWGDIIEKAQPGKIKILVRSAFTLKNGQRLERGDFPAESEIELLFPELLSYEFLKQEFEDDYSSFMTQYMNDAHGDHDVIFTPEQMLNASVAAEEVPVSGQTYISWRFAYGEKPGMQYAGAAVGMLDGGRMFIIDAVRGKFKPSQLAHEVVKLAKKHGVRQISIEDTPGARYAESAIHNYALASGWAINIQWLEFEEDDGVRDLRMKGIEPLITSSRLILADNLKVWKELKRQFCTYGMVDDSELPDVISRVADHLPKSIAVMEQTTEQDMNWEMAKQRDKYDRIHGLGAYRAAEPVDQEKPYEPPKNTYGLEEMIPGLNG